MKNQLEIYKALLDGESIRSLPTNIIYKLKDGNLYNVTYEFFVSLPFANPENYVIEENNMPYIKQEKRIIWEDVLNKLDNIYLNNPGDLNYLFTRIIKQYIEDVGKNYQSMNDIMGALEGCKQEFYRRVVSPYEDQKIKENGDV